MKLKWTTPASRDLVAVHDYLRFENLPAADRILDEIITAAEMLAKHPRLGRVGRAAGTRELVISGTPFLVMYRLKEDTVQILAVLHGKRRWPNYV